MDLEKYIHKKWTKMFKFLNFSGSGVATCHEFMEYPCSLLRAGQVEKAFTIARSYKRHWDSVLEALGKPKDEAALSQDDWVKGQTIVSKQEWYLKEFVPACVSAFFDVMDKDKDGTISLAEWREYYKMSGITNEGLILSSFAMMDSNNDNYISREEFEHAVLVFNSRHEPGRDYSFLYALGDDKNN